MISKSVWFASKSDMISKFFLKLTWDYISQSLIFLLFQLFSFVYTFGIRLRDLDHDSRACVDKNLGLELAYELGPVPRSNLYSNCRQDWVIGRE